MALGVTRVRLCFRGSLGLQCRPRPAGAQAQVPYTWWVLMRKRSGLIRPKPSLGSGPRQAWPPCSGLGPGLAPEQHGMCGRPRALAEGE